MGGHGGLNILPQKRWNVYGQRNRLKVHEDEAKHAEEQRQQREKKERAEREFKTDLMRKRARSNEETKIQHINFFEEEERHQQHEDVKRERDMEDRRRGRKSDRTSDAKFDQRFAFIHGLNDAKPWYARPATRFIEETQPLKHASSQDKTSLDSHDDQTTRSKKDKKSKKERKRKKAKELLQELKKSNFKKSEIDVALLRIERLRREKEEKRKAQDLTRRI